MKVTAFNGSARKGGNSTILLHRVFEEWERATLGRNMAWLLKKLNA